MHREVLGQSHECIVHGSVAMRVILAENLAYNTRALSVRLVGCEAQVVHSEENSPVHWLQTVPDIRQRTPNDHRHCVLQSDNGQHHINDNKRTQVSDSAQTTCI